MNRKMYCPKCEEDRTFRFEEGKETFDVRGEKIALKVPQWRCTKCGESIVDDSFGDPVAKAFDAYRAEHGLLTPAEIRRIREQWGLSQAAFATLLGMSQATINRYEMGSLQQEKEDELIRACDGREHMRSLLHRRGRLITERQRRTAEATLGQTAIQRTAYWETGFYESMPVEISKRSGFRAFDFNRYVSVVTWFCRNVSALTQTKLYKLLFYADFLAFRTSTRSITGALYRRMPYGPVPVGFSNLRAQMEAEDFVVVSEVTYQNGKTGEEFTPGLRADDIACRLDENEMRVLQFVRDSLGNLTPTDISDLSHQESAWRDTPPKQIISYEKALELSLDLPADD